LQKKEQVMSSLHISQGSFRLSDTRTLTLEALAIQRQGAGIAQAE
jgi:molybdate transport system ATP-binding protein